MTRSGLGIDTHAFAPGRALILGGVAIPHGEGLAGHSDADVLTHAVIDALLGAAALGDIGSHFPDTDERYKDADSIELAPLGDDDDAPRKAAPAKPRPSLSATPPPAVGKGEKDIFDDTYFEVDVPLSAEEESDDNTVQLEAVSDFELEDSDSGSEVFAVDEQDRSEVHARADLVGGPVDLDDVADRGLELAATTTHDRVHRRFPLPMLDPAAELTLLLNWALLLN